MDGRRSCHRCVLSAAGVDGPGTVKRTALVVIDVQDDVVGGAHERDAVVADIGSLVARA